MRDYKYVLDAGESRDVGVLGQFIHVKSASNPIKLRAEHDGGFFELVMQKGDVLKLPASLKFNSFFLSGDGGLAATGELVVGDGDFRRESTVTIGKSSVAQNNKITILANGATLIRAANISSRRVHISASATNSSVVYISKNGTPGSGFELLPGSSIIVQSTDKIMVSNMSMVNQIVGYFEEID